MSGFRGVPVIRVCFTFKCSLGVSRVRVVVLVRFMKFVTLTGFLTGFARLLVCGFRDMVFVSCARSVVLGRLPNLPHATPQPMRAKVTKGDFEPATKIAPWAVFHTSGTDNFPQPPSRYQSLIPPGHVMVWLGGVFLSALANMARLCCS